VVVMMVVVTVLADLTVGTGRWAFRPQSFLSGWST
jgi:hypothetical protein